MDRLLLDVCNIFIDNVLTDVLYLAFVYILLKVTALYICKNVELLDLAENFFSGFKRNLTAVTSVNLVIGISAISFGTGSFGIIS